jgi:hypothetical protein
LSLREGRSRRDDEAIQLAGRFGIPGKAGDRIATVRAAHPAMTNQIWARAFLRLTL